MGASSSWRHPLGGRMCFVGSLDTNWLCVLSKFSLVRVSTATASLVVDQSVFSSRTLQYLQSFILIA